MRLLQGPDGYSGAVGEPGSQGSLGEKVPDKLKKKEKLTFKSH